MFNFNYIRMYIIQKSIQNSKKVATSFLEGSFYDSAVEIVGLFWNAKKIISHQMNSTIYTFMNDEIKTQ
jgi:hypothetical protein